MDSFITKIVKQFYPDKIHDIYLPNLYYYKDDPTFVIFMFYNKEGGVVIFSENDEYPVGYVSHEWSTNQLVRFCGTIEITSN